MAFKVFGVLLILCVLQGTMSKAVKPFWGVQPAYAPTMDPDLVIILSGIQMRLNQLSSIAKSTIGKTVGMASKSVGTQMSTAKTNLKLAVNELENNPNITKLCSEASELEVDQIRTQAKNQMSICSKTSQLQLKSMNQIQKEFSMQVSTLSTEVTTLLNQCKLQHPLPTDSVAVTECVQTGSEAIMEKITALETDMLGTVSAVDTAVKQIVDTNDMCMQEVGVQTKEQLATVAQQMEQCSATPLL